MGQKKNTSASEEKLLSERDCRSPTRARPQPYAAPQISSKTSVATSSRGRGNSVRDGGTRGQKAKPLTHVGQVVQAWEEKVRHKNNLSTHVIPNEDERTVNDVSHVQNK